jgi:hypothetical protein
MGIGSMELQRMVGKNRLLTITRIFEDSKFLIFPFPFLFLLAYSVYHMCYVFLGVFCVSYLPDTVSPEFNRVHKSAPAHKHVILCASAMCRFCTAQCAVLCRCKLLRSAERAVYWYSYRQHFALYRGGAGTFGASITTYDRVDARQFLEICQRCRMLVYFPIFVLFYGTGTDFDTPPISPQLDGHKTRSGTA